MIHVPHRTHAYLIFAIVSGAQRAKQSGVLVLNRNVRRGKLSASDIRLEQIIECSTPMLTKLF